MEKRCMKSSRKELKRQRGWEREREGRWKEEGQCRYRDKGKEGRMTLAYYIEIETEKTLLCVRLIFSLHYIEGGEFSRILKKSFSPIESKYKFVEQQNFCDTQASLSFHVIDYFQCSFPSVRPTSRPVQSLSSRGGLPFLQIHAM